MKNVINIIVLSILFTLNACAQNKDAQKSKKQMEESKIFESTHADVKAQIAKTLAVYYLLKDALIADDLSEAKIQAKSFRKVLITIDMTKMTGAEHTFFMPLQTKLDYDAEHIQSAPEIEHMREHFSSFSNNMFKLVKAFKANNGQSVYLDYCPMQKASWLSNEEPIKNPYYGNKMLTCGSITETIK